MKKQTLACLLISLNSLTGAIKPTEVRVWTSKIGNKVTAKATEMTPNGAVQLITNDGRELTIGIGQFSKKDQALLRKHFAKIGNQAPDPDAGVMSGPIDADADTSYYLYVPKNHNPKAQSPVMIWTQSDGAKDDTLERFREAADALGMIIATPVEAKFEGTVTLVNNFAHTQDVLSDLKSDFKIKHDAIHFGGDKSGGAAAFQNALKIKSAGTFTVSGYLPPELNPACEGHHFMAGQTNSSYRYVTAWTSAKFTEDSTHYFYEGTRDMPDRVDIALGMTWMYAQELYENIASRATEARDFEQRITPWLTEMAENSPEDAIFLTRMLTEDCSLKGAFKQQVERLHSKLSRKREAVAHILALDELDEFSEDHLLQYGTHYTPLTNHTSPKFKRIMAKLGEKHQAAEDLRDVFKALAKPTHR